MSLQDHFDRQQTEYYDADEYYYAQQQVADPAFDLAVNVLEMDLLDLAQEPRVVSEIEEVEGDVGQQEADQAVRHIGEYGS